MQIKINTRIQFLPTFHTKNGSDIYSRIYLHIRLHYLCGKDFSPPKTKSAGP